MAEKHHLLIFNKPSEGQLKAGNYAKGHRNFQGLDVTIENPRGTLREGVDKGGKRWSTSMMHDYGYIRGTLGVDGDHVDCVVGPYSTAPNAYIVTTKAPPDFKEVDEQKVMLGFASEDAAKAAFRSMYDNPKFFGSMQTMPMEEFKRKVRKTRKEPGMLKGLVLILRRIPLGS